MIAGKFCALWSTVLRETFCYVAGAPDVDGAVRTGEYVDKGASADRCRRFSRWQMGKIVPLVHVLRVCFNHSAS